MSTPDPACLIEIAKRAREGKAPIVDGPLLYRFDAAKLAVALEQECARAKAVGWPKVSIHMDLADALKLARVLRGVR